MKNTRCKHSENGCVLVPPVWRVGVLVVLELLVVVLLAAGYDLPTALTYASGSGMAAAHVAHRMFDFPQTTRAAR